jgi:hypothetical protein
MRKVITRISPLQAAKVSALLYFFVSIPFVVMMGVATAFSTTSKSSSLFIFAFPFIYLVFGFIFTLLGAWLYNVVAGWIGGIEFTVADRE